MECGALGPALRDRRTLLSYSRQLQQYQSSQVTSASPLQLVIMLYDGALKFLRQADEAMEKKDLFKQNDAIQRVQKIVAELMSCLDFNHGGEIAQNLFALYSFVYNQLVLANIEDNRDALKEASTLLENLRVSWVELEKQQRSGAIPGGTHEQSAA